MRNHYLLTWISALVVTSLSAQAIADDEVYCKESEEIVQSLHEYIQDRDTRMKERGLIAGFAVTGVAAWAMNDLINTMNRAVMSEVSEKAEKAIFKKVAKRAVVKVALGGLTGGVGFVWSISEDLFGATAPDHIHLANHLEDFKKMAVHEPKKFCELVEKYPKVMKLATFKALMDIQNKKEGNRIIADYLEKPHKAEPSLVRSDSTRVATGGTLLLAQ